jgi:putative aldouronate transport system permease protein
MTTNVKTQVKQSFPAHQSAPQLEKSFPGAKSGSLKSDWVRNRSLYIMAVPIVLFYLIFMYKPMYGALIAFKDFSPGLGFLKSPWVGVKHFTDFFQSPDCFKLIRNTIRISLSNIIFGFPAPIILALFINELKNRHFKRMTQTISYMPHFISLVVICGLVKEFVGSGGAVTNFAGLFTGNYDDMLLDQNKFTAVYVLSGIWQEIGWNSIIYIAALAGVDEQLYEAAKIDGANKWRLLIHITIPSIVPTIVVMFILKVGTIMNLGFEKVFLLYNPVIYEKADVISTYVYRMGLEGRQWSYTTAIGLFNSAINFILVFSTNYISRKMNGTGLW